LAALGNWAKAGKEKPDGSDYNNQIVVRVRDSIKCSFTPFLSRCPDIGVEDRLEFVGGSEPGDENSF
jgi:hypothetical protein